MCHFGKSGSRGASGRLGPALDNANKLPILGCSEKLSVSCKSVLLKLKHPPQSLDPGQKIVCSVIGQPK
jgi:hypothetical protein